MKSLTKAYHYIFCALIFAIPFEDDIRIVPNILIVILLVIFPFINKDGKQKLLANHIYLTAIALVAYIVLSSLLSNAFFEDLFIIKKLVVLIAILLLSVQLENLRDVLICFIASVMLGNLISVVNIGSYIWEIGTFEIASGEKINEILFLERLYFGFVNCLSIVMSIKLWSTSDKRLKKGLAISAFLSLFLIFLVASRMAIIICVLVFLIKVFQKTTTKKAGIIIIAGVSAIIAMFVLNDNLAKRFVYSDKQKDIFHKIREWEPRFVIWKCGLSQMSDADHQLIIGDGFYGTQQNLNQCYMNSISKEKRLKYFLETRFNTHNQYLDFLLSKGVMGLGLFILLLYWLAFNNMGNINMLNILLVLLLFSLVENFLHRQIGVYLFGFILVVLALNKPEEKPSNG